MDRNWWNGNESSLEVAKAIEDFFQNEEWADGRDRHNFGSNVASTDDPQIEDILSCDGLHVRMLMRGLAKFPGGRTTYLQGVAIDAKVFEIGIVGVKDLGYKVKICTDRRAHVTFVCRQKLAGLENLEDQVGAAAVWLDADFDKELIDGKQYPAAIKKTESAILRMEREFGLVRPNRLVYYRGGIRVYFVSTKTLPKPNWESLSLKLHEIGIRAGAVLANARPPIIDEPHIVPTTGKTEQPLYAHRLIMSGKLIPSADLVESINGRHAELTSMQAAGSSLDPGCVDIKQPNIGDGPKPDPGQGSGILN